MAMDSTAVFTFDDSFEDTSIVDPSFAFFDESPGEFPPIDEQSYLNCPNQPGQELINVLDPEDPLSDPVIWAFCNNGGDMTGISPVGFAGEGCSNQNGNYNGPENPLALSVFSVPPSQYNCTFCQVLREITHTNGVNMKRLEIHGRFGVISHAVLAVYDFGSSFPSQDFQMFDFQNESTKAVKKFLVQYFEACKQEGYNTLQDPLSTFYEALCVGLNEPGNPNDCGQLSPESIIGDGAYNQQETQNKPEVEFSKIPLSMQRERTRNLKLKDFVDYFDLPIEDAARKMNICPTVMKKICRKNGVSRWPYRKIKSIERKISKQTKILDASNVEERTRALQEIEKQQQELADIYQAFTK